MIPPENYNVKVISMGFFTEGDAPIVWRGPMATKAMDKMLMGTAWGRLDVLVVDMPPGGLGGGNVMAVDGMTAEAGSGRVDVSTGKAGATGRDGFASDRTSHALTHSF